MTNKNFLKRLSIKEIFTLLVLLISGIVYIKFIWRDTINQEKEKVLQIALAVEASLPKAELNTLPDNPRDLQAKNFSQLKKILQRVIEVTPNARFAYLYLERSNQLYFIVDSEPESSRDYSPTGQEFTEAALIDKEPISKGKALVTNPVTDRWGTWVSAEVPIRDPKTGQIIAALGMDYDAKSWKSRILFEVTESSLLVIIILMLVLILMRGIQKNEILRKEIALRKLAEKGLKESESDYRLLFELNPHPMLVYDLESLKILAVNQAIVNKYGYSETEFLEMMIIDLKSSDDFIRLWKDLIDDRYSLQRNEIWNHRLKNGDTIQVEVHSHNFDFRHKDARLVLLIDITERLRIEKALNENELRLSNLVGNLPGFVYRCALDENYSMDFVSDGCTRITGYTPNEFVNQKTIAFNDLILPEYRKTIWEKWQNVIAERQFFEYEYPIKTASGEIKWLWERGGGIFDENGELLFIDGYVEDTTQQKQAVEQLKKLSKAIEQNPVSIVITDARGLIEYVNPKFTEITGYQLQEVIGQNPKILKSGEMNNEFYSELWETITSGKVWEGEIINKNKSGEFYWAKKSISPIFDNQGVITNYVANCEEITEKKRNEAELIRAKEKAEESDRLKTAFLANISHEIRTPMNGILGFAELLKGPDLSPGNQKEFIDLIELSGQRMLNIINNLINISKIEAGEMNLNISATNLNQLMDELYRFFNPEFETKGLTLSYSAELSGADCIVKTDSHMLYQILLNLIKNGHKFTNQGQVEFGYSLHEDCLKFFVKDTGIGIPDDQIHVIFERFRQGSYTLCNSYEGAGLGLTLSKAYVQLLGGKIDVESELNKGTTVWFEIPYYPINQNKNVLTYQNEN